MMMCHAGPGLDVDGLSSDTAVVKQACGTYYWKDNSCLHPTLPCEPQGAIPAHCAQQHEHRGIGKGETARDAASPNPIGVSESESRSNYVFQ